MDAIVLHLEEKVEHSQAGMRLDCYLLFLPFSDHHPSLSPSRSGLQKWIENGCVKVNGKAMVDKSYRVKTGDTVSVEVTIEPQAQSPPPEDLDISILHVDEHFIVIDKPPGITSHPVKHEMTGSVVNFLRYQGIPSPPSSHPMRPGIVHRLDKNTSGLMVVACTDQAQRAFVEMMKRREIERRYLAIICGNIPTMSGTIEVPIGRSDADRSRMSVVRDERGKPARTHYKVMTIYPAFALISCKLDTGRTHQIRVHMSHMGFPVAGDRLYGGLKIDNRVEKALRSFKKRDPIYAEVEAKLGQIGEILISDSVHLLHAARLRFPHPVTGEVMTFTARPHEKFQRVLGLLETLPHTEVGDAV